MFAKTIVLSDVFLDMPMSARCLYFTLGMLADDDGFVNAPRSIMRQCGASEDDMRVLISKKFVLEFESGVIVIKHWRINNYLRNDRYTCTKYTDEKKALCIDEKGSYSLDKAELEVMVLSDSVGKREGREIREEAYEKSSLPYCFGYKIRQSFTGEKCPVCGCTMKNYDGSPTMPTIQHNIPISKGGEHELYNISVICKSCNVRLKDAETGSLNNADVIKKWNEISGIPNSGIPSIGKDSIDKDSVENIYIAQKSPDDEANEKRFSEFWEAYGNKKGKKNAFKAFSKIHPDEELFQQIMSAVEKYHQSRKWREGYRKEPATWLNGECWNDEYNDESEVNPNGIPLRNDRQKGGGNRKSAGAPNLKPRFVGHVYDADGNDITPGI